MSKLMMPKTTSIHFLYDNPIGRLFLNEEGRSIWNGCRNPYKQGVISLAEDEADLDSDPLRASYVHSIPMCKLYKGLLLQGYLISPKFMRSLSSFHIRPDDLFICSYPRSGTTWTEEIVSCIFSRFDQNFMKKPVHYRIYHLEVGRPFGQRRFLDSLKSPRLLGTHLPLSHCPEQLRQLHSKVIYVARNPKDQAVSYFHFHHTAKYLGRKKWDWDTFVKLFMRGHLVYGSWFDHVKEWYLLSLENPDKILFITYEELQVNLREKVSEIADFLDISLDGDLTDRIVEHCRFNQMKGNTAVNREAVPVTDLFAPSQFMRKGVIGDWKNYFTNEQSKAFDDLFGQKMKGTNLQFAYDDDQAITQMLSTVLLPKRKYREDADTSSSASSGTVTPSSLFRVSSNMTLENKSNSSLEKIEAPVGNENISRVLVDNHSYTFEIEEKVEKDVIFDRPMEYHSSL